VFFFFNDTATTEIYTLSLHDALPILRCCEMKFDAELEEQQKGGLLYEYTSPAKPRRGFYQIRAG